MIIFVVENLFWDIMFVFWWNNIDVGIFCDVILVLSVIIFVIDIFGVNVGDFQVCNYVFEFVFY